MAGNLLLRTNFWFAAPNGHQFWSTTLYSCSLKENIFMYKEHNKYINFEPCSLRPQPVRKYSPIAFAWIDIIGITAHNSGRDKVTAP